ncbi:hypothetical protein EDD86DRAFT_193601 [Gorgonomyces haynaldii]|nr:hypothetical protein EDD86DRAFT_193601 [Gorgonomyces haynaldii]
MFVIVGKAYHSLSVSEFVYMPLVAIGVENGIIQFVRTVEGISDLDQTDLLVLGENEFLIPGFVDTHIHGPQYVFTGTGYDMTLLKWLETYTFPKEANFKSIEYATENYKRVVRKTLRSGTTTACYYATTHTQSSLVLAKACYELGQRAYVGKVNMDRNSPDYYSESTQESIQETVRFVQEMAPYRSLVKPVLTPRFVPSCTPELMRALGKLAKEQDLPIQSHLSETPSEIEWVKELHPDQPSYSHVYDQFGLLTNKTIMAHCVHLTKQERELLKARGVGISHCASSNFCLHSGSLNVRRLFEEGIDNVGLGTDVAGGYSPSILDAMRQSIIASKVVHIQAREQGHETPQPLSFSEAFYLATLGGAKCMGLDNEIGNFLVGKRFDALVVSLDNNMDKQLKTESQTVSSGTVDLFEHDTPDTRFEKFVYLGDDRNIKYVFVNGKQIV